LVGFPLAKSFIEKDFLVKEQRTSPDKLEILNTRKISPPGFILSEQHINGDIQAFLKGCNDL